jgi:drug/metabolite transporter (DMT)-like permease
MLNTKLSEVKYSLFVPVWSMVATLTLWALIGLHIVFPVSEVATYLYHVINTIFVLLLCGQIAWFSYMAKTKLGTQYEND